MENQLHPSSSGSITKDEISSLFSSDNLSMEQLLRKLTMIIKSDQNRDGLLKGIIKGQIIEKIKNNQLSFVKLLTLFSVGEIFDEWEKLDSSIQSQILILLPDIQKYITSKNNQKTKDLENQFEAFRLSVLNQFEVLKQAIDNLKSDINKKVDKETGKGLISNDFTKEYQNAVNNLNKNISTLETSLKQNVLTLKQNISNLEETKLSVDGGTINGSLTINSSLTINGTINNSNLKSIINSINSNINKKVDKETGKGLSSNDFTQQLKEKLDAIEIVNDLSSYKINLSNSVLSAYQSKLINDRIKACDKRFKSIDTTFISLAPGTDLNTITEIGNYALIYSRDVPSIINKPNSLVNAFYFTVSLAAGGPTGYIGQELIDWVTGQRFYRAYDFHEKKWYSWYHDNMQQ